MAAAPVPRYVEFKESARIQMLEIRAKMGELRKLHGQVGLLLSSLSFNSGCQPLDGTSCHRLLLRPQCHQPAVPVCNECVSLESDAENHPDAHRSVECTLQWLLCLGISGHDKGSRYHVDCGMQASLTSFDDTGNKELEIEVVTQEVTRLFKLTEGQLQKFGAQHSLSDSEQKANFLFPHTFARCD